MPARGYAGAVMRTLGAREQTLTVVSFQDITPHYRRITFHAPSLFDGQPIHPAAWVRIWAPDPDRPGREHQRGYTLLDPDPVLRQVSMEFVLHEPAGPASTWAGRVRVGDTLQMTRWGSKHFAAPDPAPDGYLLVGDAASLPGINSILAAVPPTTPVVVLLERHHPDDVIIPMTSHPLATITWVPEGPGALAEAIEDRDWSNWFAWVTPESGAGKRVRARLKQLGFPASEVKAQAYWVKGKAMGVDRDDRPGGEGAEGAEGAKGTPAVEAATDAAVTEEAREAAGSATPPADGATNGQAGPSGDGSTNGATRRTTTSGPVATETTTSETTTSETTASETTGASGAGARQRQWRSTAGSRLLAPVRGKLVLAAAVQAVVSLLQLAPYLLLIELCRRILADGMGAAGLTELGVWALILLGAGTTLAGALVAVMHVVDARFGHEVRRRVVGKLARLPLGWFTDRSSGRVKQAVQGDAASVHYLVTHAALDVVAALVTPLAVLTYLFTVDAAMAAILLVPILAYVILTARMMQASTSQIAQFPTWEGRVSSEAIAYVDGLSVVRTYDAGPAGGFRATLAERARFLDGWQRPLTSRKVLIDLVTRPMTILLLIVVVGGAAGLVRGPDLLPFLVLGVTFGGRLLAVAYGMGSVRESMDAARRIGLLLAEPELTAPAPATSVGQGSPGRTVRFENVSFAYTADHDVLSGIDLELAPGTVTALVGPSGAGKSTLATLLARFHDVTTGRITIGGTDLRDLTQEELYRTVGFVFQDVSLIRAGVHDNIALARPGATREEVVRAAEAAQIHDRITRLPAGYDTVLGEQGRLSGGEAQRLTIARALLADPPVLVLDEATAFADPESEHRVQEALSTLAAGRAVLVIAHRLHTIAGADCIVVLDHGRIAERGTHAELLDRPGLYRDLWHPQELPV
ncbi:ABC transporter ATP-binding protein/permease [Nonomuraea soli]|uniref:Mycobactin import ATP-binding/permease protein IrtA n=1 Tax=Nonomuraea soli TaxID=1032476 RepID=A0A7W0HPJ2_9ACTN|nr:ATP-binding cassette domain-containing protein [Nonomuraea soli]MBA2890933.1 ATP-binding cassette subfamily B protein IrtA [Nonomuraea soli]